MSLLDAKAKTVLATAKQIARRFLVPYRLWAMRRKCYREDVRNDRLHVGWYPPSRDYWKLSSELIFQHHKLEKGLCLPAGARQFFGQRPANATIALLARWKAAGLPTDAAVYQSSLGVLEAYGNHLSAISPPEPQAKPILERIGRYLADQDAAARTSFQTPVRGVAAPEGSYEMLQALSLSRRSTRDFSSNPVETSKVENAISVAQLSPSACNRQPWKIHLYRDPDAIRGMLALQNGNRGFGHTIPLLAVVSADLGSFFDASERIEPVLDGGLFLMSFILALQAQGLASCCLNWCVPPETDRNGHAIGDIPANEKILTYLAIGYAREGHIVPLSARRPMTDVVRWH